MSSARTVPLSRLAWWLLMAVAVVGNAAATPYADRLQNQSFVITQLTYVVVGAFVAWRRPGNPIGWVLLSAGALAGLLGAANTLSEVAFDQYVPGVPVPWWGILGAWLSQWVWFLLLYAMTALMILLYPDGLPSPRWRPFLWLSAAVVAAVCLVSGLGPFLLLGDNNGGAHSLQVPNPLSPSPGGDAGAAVGVFATIVNVAGLVIIVVSAASLFWRRRRASDVTRLQLRWFAFAVAIVLVAIVLDPILPGGDSGLLSNLSSSLSVACIPVACGIAIMRYRLYDIDRIVSRTASYAIVTALLVLTYVLIVTSVSRVLGSQSSLVVAAATLAAAALFRPLLTRVQRVVDRRFNREKVDHQRAVDLFGVQLADGADAARVSDELVAVTRRTLAPVSVSVWTVRR